MVKERLEEIVSEILMEKKNVEIRGYVKKPNKTRLTEGIVDVVIDTNLPPYIDLLNMSLRELKSIKAREQAVIREKFDVEQDVVDKAFEEIENSLKRSIKNYDTRKENAEDDPLVDYLGAGIFYNRSSSSITFKGKEVSKRVKLQEQYKPVKSRPKTLVKKYINGKLPNNIKQYKISTTELNKLKLV